MRILTAVLFSFFVCFSHLTVSAQREQVSSGVVKEGLSELKDKTRVFVSAASDAQTDNIVKALRKKSTLQIVSDFSQAEFVIFYSIEKNKSGVSIGPPGMPPLDDWVYFGRMSVYVPQKDNTSRLIWENRRRFSVPPPSTNPPLPGMQRNWEQPLEKSAIAKFIKALRKARDEKN